MDPQKVGTCGPGVEKVEVIDDTHFKIHAKVGIGLIRATFLGKCRLDEQLLQFCLYSCHGLPPCCVCVSYVA
jgi:carbon monoxide dehydrogenase subunit G